MKNHVAVIGANFGDEGKGQMVDYFSSSGNFEYVVRFNGGSQAGHTVVTKNGKRHIFSQLGAGSFQGLPTHLSRFVYINPIYLEREIRVFYELTGKLPLITIDPRAKIVFPLDVSLNQLTETFRGKKRHGSTGHGIFNAVTRSLSAPNEFFNAEYFFSKGYKNNLYSMVKAVNSYYQNSNSDKWIEEFYEASSILNNYSLSRIFICADDEIINKHNCIFEGAQGLLLDQNSGFFPHVTPSNTGLTNVVNLLSEANDYYDVRPVYVTRSFLTRHGNGPLYYEKFESPLNYDIETEELEDDTNVSNQWQGKMRYGKLNINQLLGAINTDFNRAIQQGGSRLELSKYVIALTWANINSQLDIISALTTEHNVGYISEHSNSVFSI